MSRKVTIFTGQWTDLTLEEIAKLANEWGYDGLEIATWGHIDVSRAATDDEYVQEVKDILKKYDLSCTALGCHLPSQCVGDLWDPRLDGFAPAEFAGKPDEIRNWAIEEVKNTARAAEKMGCDVVTGFMGSAVWKYWYSFPQTTAKMIDDAFSEQVELWTPIFDVFDDCGVKFALEVHPTEIAFDYWTTVRLFEEFDHRETLGLNYDPSHLLWQGVDPIMFLSDFRDRVYHVHMKDVAMNLDGRNGILGSHLEFGDMRRGWNFVSLGHGDVDFDKIIRLLNEMNYQGPLSVEWEDSGMDRLFGAKEAYEYVKQIDFDPSDVAFDSAMKSE